MDTYETYTDGLPIQEQCLYARCGLRAKSVHLCSRRKTLTMLDFTKETGSVRMCQVLQNQ